MNKTTALALAMLLSTTGSVNAQLLKGRFEQDPLERIYLDIRVLDLPYQASASSSASTSSRASPSGASSSSPNTCPSAPRGATRSTTAP